MTLATLSATLASLAPLSIRSKYGRWLVREGFGSFVSAEIKHGRCVSLQPRRKADGTVKVVKADIFVGYLLEMATGSSSTLKGSAAADLMARAATEVATACGKRSKMRCARACVGGALAPPR